MNELESMFADLAAKGPLDWPTFHTELGRIRANHLGSIPPDITTDVLLGMFRELGWLIEHRGKVSLKFQDRTPREIRDAERAAFA